MSYNKLFKNNNFWFQIEGAFVQGLGFFMLEEYETNLDGLSLADGTWTYKIPTIDTIPKQFNVEILSTGNHQKRVLSSKGMLHQSFVPFSDYVSLFVSSILMFKPVG